MASCMPSLNWIGKDAVVKHHQDVPYRLLEPVPALSCGEPGSGNLIVQGDNLHALKSLLPRYAGQVKCIYIDPPYNTGNEGWAYNDNVNSPEIRQWLGAVVGREGETLDRHDRWLCMMYPRLVLLRQFLREDGAIFVSIDDNEVAHLRLLMDEIFGVANFETNLVWQKKYAVASDAKGFSNSHDHILVYVKNGRFQRNLLPRSGKQDLLYKYDDKDGNGPWRTDNLSVKTYSENYDYPLVNPKTGKEYWPPKGRCWYTSREKMALLLASNGIYFGKDGAGAPQLKRYLARVQSGVVPSTWWTHEDAGHNDESRKESKVLFEGSAHETEKSYVKTFRVRVTALRLPAQSPEKSGTAVPKR